MLGRRRRGGTNSDGPPVTARHSGGHVCRSLPCAPMWACGARSRGAYGATDNPRTITAAVSLSLSLSFCCARLESSLSFVPFELNFFSPSAPLPLCFLPCTKIFLCPIELTSVRPLREVNSYGPSNACGFPVKLKYSRPHYVRL